MFLRTAGGNCTEGRQESDGQLIGEPIPAEDAACANMIILFLLRMIGCIRKTRNHILIIIFLIDRSTTLIPFYKTKSVHTQRNIVLLALL